MHLEGKPMRKVLLGILAVGVMLGVAVLALASPSNAQYVITEIIDSTGDGAGTRWLSPGESPWILAATST
jgi:hypothetical protein